jgi:hypothetical protein
VDFDTSVKLAVYRHFASTGDRPTVEEISAGLGADAAAVRAAYARLRLQRVLVLESDGVTIRMAPPFSGVPTQHAVIAGGTRYHANCAWDALGIPAALGQPGVVHSRCEQSGEPLVLEVGLDGPAESSWLFHCPVPAARWWQDIVFT